MACVPFLREETVGAMADRILIGQIVGAIGLKGEVKVQSYAEDPSRFSSLAALFVGTRPGGTLGRDVRGRSEDLPAGEELTPFAVTGVRYKGQTPIVTLEGVTDRMTAEAMQFCYVYMDAQELPPLAEGEYYVRDLLGLAVVTEEGDVVGTLKEIRTETPQKLYVVEREGRGDVYIPGVDAFILSCSKEEGRITVRLPEGLLDL